MLIIGCRYIRSADYDTFKLCPQGSIFSVRMVMKKNIGTSFLFLCCLFSLLFPPMVTAQSSQADMAFLPFTVTSSKDMSYLRDGLRQMLVSRISAETGVSVVDKQKTDAAFKKAGTSISLEQVASLSAKLGADYVLYGSVTVLGAGMSFDAKVYSAADNKSQNFYSTAATEDDIMKAIDSLAWDVAAEVFGKQRPAKYAVASPRAAAPVDPYQTAHPDRAYLKSGGFAGVSSKWIDGGQRFVKTRNIDLSMEAIAMGDVDGDGQLDVVMADRQVVKVFHLRNNRLNEFASTKLFARYKIHAVNVADLNNDGKSEIYISAADYNTAGSRGVEWDGEKLVTLFDEARFYIRPMMVPSVGVTLVGQRKGLDGQAIDGPIYTLIRDGDQLVTDEKIPIPVGLVLFNIAFADLEGNGDWKVVNVDQFSKLRVLETSGKVLWQSQDRYGATKRSVGGENVQKTPTSQNYSEMPDGREDMFEKTWINSRIVVKDLDQDGIDDIMLNKNHATFTSSVRDMQSFPSGMVMGMRWNGLGMEEIWQTKKIDGYVVDYELESEHLDNEAGEDRLFVGVVTQGGFMDVLTGDSSTLLVYPFVAKKDSVE